MSMRILGGSHQGAILSVPKGNLIRPTSVLLKRRVFDSFQDFSSMVFIDLCAGSGAVGLEAWSRGAAQLYLVESDKKVLKNLESNVKKILSRNENDNLTRKSARKILIERTCAVAWIRGFKRTYLSWSEEKRKSTIIFFDPPYCDFKLYQSIISMVIDQGWFQGEFWPESDEKTGPPLLEWINVDELLIKKIKQGSSYVLMLDI